MLALLDRELARRVGEFGAAVRVLLVVLSRWMPFCRIPGPSDEAEARRKASSEM